jgi:DNA-binding MarR family transcriptional regulator
VAISDEQTTRAPFDPIEEAARHWRLRWGDEPIPAMVAVTSIMRVQQILLARLNALLRDYDLTFPRYEALMLLYFSRRGSLPLGKMAPRLQVHRTSVTNIIDGLERARLVERVPHESDRRMMLATITERGRETAAAATEMLNDALFSITPLDASELGTLADVLRRVREHAGDFSG